MLYLLVVLGFLADSATFLMLPPGAELNPIVLALPVWLAVAARAAATAVLVLSATYVERRWLRELLLGSAIAAGFLGAGSNLSVLL